MITPDNYRTAPFITFVLHLVAIISLCVLSGCTTKEPSIHPGYRIVKDDFYRFELQLPSDWKVQQANNPNSHFRLKAAGKPGKTLAVYAVRSNLPVDLEKLTTQSEKLIAGVGSLEKTKYYPDWFCVPWLIDAKGTLKTYRQRARLTSVLVGVNGPYGYILVLKGMSEEEFEPVLSSFQSTFTAKEGVYTYANYVGVFVIAWLMGSSGYTFRSKLMLLKFLKTMLPENATKNLKWERRRALAVLFLAPVWCLALYLFGIRFLESTLRTIFMIVGPILPVLGYFGIIREPPDEI